MKVRIRYAIIYLVKIMMKRITAAVLAVLLSLFAALNISLTSFAEEEADNSVLLAVLQNAESLSESDYTPESYVALQQLYNIYSPAASEMDTQEEIDSAVSQLLEAISSLVPYLNLTVSANIEGVSIDVDYDGDGVVFGTPVTVSAPEVEGYFFAGWMETVSKRILSDSSEFTFTISVNMSLQAIYFRTDTSILIFATESGFIVSFTEKTPQEWAQTDSLDDYIPAVPYSYGYTNGRWDLPSDALEQLAAGEYVYASPVYDEAQMPTLPAIITETQNRVILELHYHYDADNTVGSFVMNTSIPYRLDTQSVGMLFYYKKASSFNPETFYVNINNKMMVSQYDMLYESVYVTNMKKMNAKYNWAVRGYLTYTDENGELQTVYSNQVNIVNTEDIHDIRTSAPIAPTCTATGSAGESYCYICGTIYDAGGSIPALGHQYEESVTPPTCTANGYITHTCSRCGNTYTEEPVLNEATGEYTHPELLKTEHDYQITAVTQPATLTEIGTCTAICSVCGDETEFPYYIAEGSCGGGVTYTFDHRTDTLTISGNGSMPDYEQKSESPFGGLTNIRHIVIEHGVTNIGSCAFYGCSGLEDIIISDTVSQIGNRAFYQCTGLTTVAIPGNVTDIEYHAFYGCTSLLSLTLGEGITTIAEYAFSTCTALTELTIPASVTTIGRCAFTRCSALTGVTLPATVTDCGTEIFSYCTGLTQATVAAGTRHLEGYTFYGCSALESVSLPDSLLIIGERAFFRCDALSNITLPARLAYIDPYAFYHCISLGNITLPDSVISIGNSAFENCSALNTSLPSNLSQLGSSAFGGCAGLTEVVIPSTLTAVPISAFNGCSALQSVTIPATVTEIGNSAFYQTTSLTSLTLPNSVTSIGNNAFYGSGITSLALPSSVETIGNSAFSACSSMESISVDSGNVTFDSRNNCNAIIRSSDNTLLFGCKNTVVDSTVTAIGSRAFENCTELTAIALPASVSSIESYAFNGCTNLTSITLPDGLTAIKEQTFGGCGALTAVTIPQSVTSIEKSAFLNCSSLAAITLPDNLSTLGTTAFSGCTGLTEITVPGGVNAIGGRAFIGCSGITSLTIESGVRTIGSSAFADCSGITAVTLPNTVTTISSKAFKGCSAMTDIYIYNISCTVASGADTLPENAVIHAYLSSKAKDYADTYNRQFRQLT